MMLALGALLIGGLVGVLTGLFGVGGGFLITPLMNIVLGVPMPIAVGTSAIQILGVSTNALYERRNGERPALKMAIVLFGGNFVGVQLGASLLACLAKLGSVHLGESTIAVVDLALLLIFLPLLLGIAWWLYCDTSKNPISPVTRIGWFARLKIPPYTQFPGLESPQLSVIVMVYFGLCLGLLTGLLGIGGGVLLLPTLVYLVGLRTRRAISTSLLMVWLTSIVAVVTHTLAGNVDLLLAVPLLFGGILGARVGSRLCVNLSGNWLRRAFVYVVLFTAVIVVSKLVALLI
ncbi:MAG: sulfite exporter TauE/SafE family protein [Anaerolineae bacterium]